MNKIVITLDEAVKEATKISLDNNKGKILTSSMFNEIIKSVENEAREMIAQEKVDRRKKIIDSIDDN